MKKVLVRFIVLILFCISAYFAFLAYDEYKPVMRAEKQQEAVISAVIEDVQSGDDAEADDTNDPYDRKVDFEVLKEINADASGWIYIPDTSVDYPVLIGETDDEYLKVDIEGNKSSLGSIFSYADTSRNLTDARTVLLGHNMRNYQMFGELKRYLDEDFRNNHTKMYIYTEDRTLELTVFSVFVCKETDDILWDDTKLGTVEYQKLLQELVVRNDYPDINMENVSDLYNMQSFSLVTCKGRQGTSNRLVVSGIVTREKSVSG